MKKNIWIRGLFLCLTCVLGGMMLTGCGSKMVSDKQIKEDIVQSGVTDLYSGGWSTLDIDSCEITEHKTTEYTDNATCYVVLSSPTQDYVRYAYCYLTYGKYEQGWNLDRADWEYDFTAM